MRFVLLFVVLLLQVQFTHNRFAEDGNTFSQDGSSLMTDCISKVEEDASAAMFCGGYVEGVADLLSGSTVCIPPEVSGKLLVDVVVQYAEKHQDILHRSANRLVAEAPKDKYHCSQRP